ncbi:MAG: hypothetical protein ABJB49_05565 [Nitrospirota bacterium]
MCGKLACLFLPVLLLPLAGCKRPAHSPGSTTNASPDGGPHEARGAAFPISREWAPAQFDVCGLISKEEIEKAQESRIQEAQSVARPDGDFLVTQCFYSAEIPSKSVILAITQADPRRLSKRSPKDFWRETFGPLADSHDRERLETARGEFIAPKKIEGIGDDAYWMGGALYVSKSDSYIRISLGGSDTEEAKLEKSTALARLVLSRL